MGFIGFFLFDIWRLWGLYCSLTLRVLLFLLTTNALTTLFCFFSKLISLFFINYYLSLINFLFTLNMVTLHITASILIPFISVLFISILIIFIDVICNALSFLLQVSPHFSWRHTLLTFLL